jgi:hypothetical protein
VFDEAAAAGMTMPPAMAGGTRRAKPRARMLTALALITIPVINR